MPDGFWSGRRVFLTGHTGFKGSWLAFWLSRLGAQVTGYALPPPMTAASIFNDARLDQLVHHVEGDIRDMPALAAAVDGAQPEIVFHMAAQSLVRQSYLDPAETYATNVMGTVHLLDAVRRSPSVRAVIVVTSDKCYENREWHWGYRENDPLGGYDPYSSSKGCAELVTAAYRNSYFNASIHAKHQVALATARAGNVIGGGDWATDRIVPDVIRALLAGEKPLIRYPEAIRPWQHVLEPLAGYMCLAERLYIDGSSFATAWNFGPDDDNAQPVETLVRLLCAAWGRDAAWLRDARSHPHEAAFLKLDCSRARARLGWVPKWDLSATVGHTVEWYRAHAATGDPRRVMAAQIDAYLHQCPQSPQQESR